jgi:hypothetical protein
MKLRVFSFIIGLQCIALSLFGQQLKDEDLPPGLVYEFKNRFPGVELVSWSLQNDIYYADFMFMGLPVLAQYEKTTKWIGSESIMTFDDLPKTIQRYITTNYPNHRFKKAKFIEKRNETGYYSIETTDNEEQRFLFFDKDGVFQRMSDKNDKDIVTGVIKNEHGSQPVATRELPTAINSYIMINYSSFKISESYLVNNDEWENTYYIILASNMSNENVKLWFDFKGNLVKKMDPNEKETTTTEDNTTKPKKDKTPKERQPLSETQVPQPVRDSFSKKIKKHEDLRWDTIKGKYVASYFDPIKQQNCKAEFTRQGSWILTSIELDPGSLNQNILRHVEQNYPYLKILSAENVTTADKKRYILLLIYDNKWLNDPMVYHELYFSTSGRLEREVYADFIDPYDAFENEDYEARNENFLEYVDGDDLSTAEEYKQINPRELPTRAVRHTTETYPEHRIAECYIMTDDFTGETIYWVILKKEGVRTRIKATYNFKGEFIDQEEY